jgi:hypothetical protein
MNVLKLSAAMISLGLLMAAPAFAQSTTAQKQHTQEGGGASMPMPCGQPYNADPAADPDCRQRTQNLTPSADQALKQK